MVPALPMQGSRSSTRAISRDEAAVMGEAETGAAVVRAGRIRAAVRVVGATRVGRIRAAVRVVGAKAGHIRAAGSLVRGDGLAD